MKIVMSSVGLVKSAGWIVAVEPYDSVGVGEDMVVGDGETLVVDEETGAYAAGHLDEEGALLHIEGQVGNFCHGLVFLDQREVVVKRVGDEFRAPDIHAVLVDDLRVEADVVFLGAYDISVDLGVDVLVLLELGVTEPAAMTAEANRMRVAFFIFNELS